MPDYTTRVSIASFVVCLAIIEALEEQIKKKN